MTVDTVEPNGPVRHDGIEVCGRRKTPFAPALFVPAASGNPTLVRMLCGKSGEFYLHLFKRAGVVECHMSSCEAQLRQVHMRVDQAREERPPIAVDFALGRPIELLRALD